MNASASNALVAVVSFYAATVARLEAEAADLKSALHNSVAYARDREHLAAAALKLARDLEACEAESRSPLLGSVLDAFRKLVAKDGSPRGGDVRAEGVRAQRPAEASAGSDRVQGVRPEVGADVHEREGSEPDM